MHIYNQIGVGDYSISSTQFQRLCQALGKEINYSVFMTTLPRTIIKPHLTAEKIEALSG